MYSLIHISVISTRDQSLPISQHSVPGTPVCNAASVVSTLLMGLKAVKTMTYFIVSGTRPKMWLMLQVGWSGGFLCWFFGWPVVFGSDVPGCLTRAQNWHNCVFNPSAGSRGQSVVDPINCLKLKSSCPSYVHQLLWLFRFHIGFTLAHLVHVYADRGRSHWDVLDTPPPN